MKGYKLVEVAPHAVLTSTLGGGEWSASCPGRFITRKNPGTHWIDDRVLCTLALQ
jgi:hypothetical protein